MKFPNRIAEVRTLKRTLLAAVITTHKVIRTQSLKKL